MPKAFMLSVIIPSYNEMANLQKGVLEKVKQYLSKQQFEYEVLIVDDGSDDGSREFVKRFTKDNKNFRILENNHLGKAGAVTSGVLSANGDFIMFADMDQATPIEELEKLLPFTDDYDVVIGGRKKRKGSPLSRRLMSSGVIILRKIIVGLADIQDTQCGFKLFKKKAALDIFGQIKKIHSGFQKIKGSSVTAGFDVEVLYIAFTLGYKVKEVPVEWLYVETRRVNPVKDSIEGLLGLLVIRNNIIHGVYKS